MKLSNLDAENSAIWTTEKVNKLLEDFENGLIDIKTIKNSPFKDNDPVWKKANIVFEYTPDELEELKKCKSDPIYFANKYAQVMQEHGIDQINLRDYQEEIIKSFKDNRFNILMASRQIGKCFYPSTLIIIQPINAIVLTSFLNFSKKSKIIDPVELSISTIASELYFYFKSLRKPLNIFDKIRRYCYIFVSDLSWIKYIAKLIIFLIERYEFRNKKLDQNNLADKFQEAFSVDSLFSIKTDTGFSPIALCNRTQPYNLWKIETISGKTLEGADHHILFRPDLSQVLISELKVGDLIVTVDGAERVTLIKSSDLALSMLDFSLADFNHRYWTNGILSHNTVMSGVFIAWYLVFHTDKNVLAVANVASTTKEVLDKIKSVLENLPFFLKPGCISNNVMSMKFDNGCRLIGRTTTKNTGIGFTIHVLYIDEFAHINPAYLDFFYRAIYPTITGAGSQSKVIITSTPNGMNRFHDIYVEAVIGKNSYVPLRVDWWQVPGRDDEWKKMTIANLGSEEDFNQEYGLQFFSSDKLLLPSKDLKKVFSFKIAYQVPDWAQEPDVEALMDGFSAHPNFAKLSIDDIRNDGNNYIFSIDTASGVGRDYSVVNIFKLTALPVKLLEQIKQFIKNEGDLFTLVQVASLRTNKKDINEFCNSIEHLLYKVFNYEKVKILLELDHKGDYVLDKLSQSEDFWPGIIIHSKHTVSSVHWKPGLKMTETNKTKYCERFKYLVAVNKILPNEFKTVHELGSFGKMNNGTYRSQNGNDDLAMTCVATSAFFESPNFWELVNEELDRLPKEYLKEVYAKYLGTEYAGTASQYDYDSLRSLNTTPEVTKPGATRRVDESYISSYKEVMEKFYGKSQSNEN
jgi:hypothetical protein